MNWPCSQSSFHLFSVVIFSSQRVQAVPGSWLSALRLRPFPRSRGLCFCYGEPDCLRLLLRSQTHRVSLLSRRGELAIHHPDPIATTWSLSLKRVEQKSPRAVAMLRLCAYL